MVYSKFKALVQQIVSEAQHLKDKHTDEKAAPVNYACIFCHGEAEYKDLLEVVQKMGKVVRETAMGPIFHIEPLETSAGKLQLLKIRKPDVSRPERGDADFTVSDYSTFKKTYLAKPGFQLLIKSETFEMLELVDARFNVRAYFSNPPLDEQLGLSLT